MWNQEGEARLSPEGSSGQGTSTGVLEQVRHHLAPFQCASGCHAPPAREPASGRPGMVSPQVAESYLPDASELVQPQAPAEEGAGTDSVCPDGSRWPAWPPCGTDPGLVVSTIPSSSEISQ